MTIRIAILDDYQNAALDAADWASLGDDAEITVFDTYIEGEAALAEALQGFDVVIGMRERTAFPKSLIDALPNLKLLVTTGMRNFSFDMNAARDRGIVVSGTTMLGYPASEHAVALMMALFKKIPLEDRSMHEGGWQADVPEGMNGKTLGVLGLGKLGSKVARVGLALDMNVRSISVPVTARFFPLTRNARVQPYVGGGAMIHFWRYTEERALSTGMFSSQSSVIDQGITAGPVVFGGARVPVGPTVSIGGEVRYRTREARLTAPVFAGTTLDLGGLSTVATVQFRIP